LISSRQPRNNLRTNWHPKTFTEINIVQPKTFAEAFCDCYNFPLESFVKEVLFRCIYPHARRPMKLFYLLGTRTAMEASAFISAAGNTRNKEELNDLISLFHNDVKPFSGILVRRFKIRVSCERLLMLHSQVRKSEIQKELFE
jgi:hypothetical protein